MSCWRKEPAEPAVFLPGVEEQCQSPPDLQIPGCGYSPLGASGSGPGPGCAHGGERAESMYQCTGRYWSEGKEQGKLF